MPTRVVEALLERMATSQTESRLVHGDLGPEHIRVVGERIGGVIDWGDTVSATRPLGSRLDGTGIERGVREAVVAAYRPDDGPARPSA